ncbi:MAG: hypothetical protein KAR79_06265 [Simkaniaceae bacterium]|nr:hypothetical protein [Simkaniaceae bacterium]
MEIWLDTTNYDLIKRAKNMGLLTGVTTNPSILKASKDSPEKTIETIVELQNGPITMQVTEETHEKMIDEAKTFCDLSDQIIIKVPVTKEGLITIAHLNHLGIPVMATVIFTPFQALLAARAGASYLAPYFSQIENATTAVKEMVDIIEKYQYKTKILAASIKTLEQIEQCYKIGVHGVTLKEEIFEALTENHPQTIEKVQRFSKD